MNRKTFKILNIVAVIITIGVNLLANILPFNNQYTGQIAERFSIYFLPAGYVFSIWGLIYLALIGYAYFQARPDQQDNPRVQRADLPFLLSCVGNVAWLFLFHYNYFVLSELAILLLLGALIAVYLAFEVGEREAPPLERWLAQAVFSLYLGWASVATISNTALVLDSLNWSGWGVSEEAWAVVMLAIGVLLGLAMALLRKDIIFNLVFIWAYIGIAIRYSQNPLVAGAAWAGAGVLVLWIILIVLRQTTRPSKQTIRTEHLP
jgi:translocator protein